jgi:hypothetical protein
MFDLSVEGFLLHTKQRFAHVRPPHERELSRYRKREARRKVRVTTLSSPSVVLLVVVGNHRAAAAAAGLGALRKSAQPAFFVRQARQTTASSRRWIVGACSRMWVSNLVGPDPLQLPSPLFVPLFWNNTRTPRWQLGVHLPPSDIAPRRVTTHPLVLSVSGGRRLRGRK